MPIDIDRFEQESSFADRDTYAERIVRFLAANDDKAFRRREIADATDIDPDAASSVLSRLKERGLVRHKDPYWAAGDDRRLATASNLSLSLDALDEQRGEEEMDAWRAAGTDEPHPSERDEGTE